MTRIGKPTPSAPRAEVRRQTGEVPHTRPAGQPRPSSAGQASGFDTRRTYSRLTGVSSKRSSASHVSLERVDDLDDPSQGRNRGTPDDSIGRNRGTPDDSIGRNRGTPDDSIGRNRGTPDDSIGRGGARSSKKSEAALLSELSGFLPAGRRGDDARDQLAFLLRGGKTRAMRENGTTRDEAVAAMFGFGAGVSNRRDDSGMRASAGRSGPVSLMELASLLSQERKRPTTGAAPSPTVTTQSVLDSREFRALSPDEQRAVQGVLDKGGPHAAAGLSEVFRTNQVDLLRERDANGVSVLEHLEALAASPHPNLAGDLLSDIATPKDIEQGYAPTCTAASMQYELAKEHPAEYARLLAGLATDGAVTMSGGAQLTVDVARVIAQSNASNDQRTDSEAVFQTAAMDFANGEDVFNVDRQRSEGAGRTYRGLFPDQVRALMGQLLDEHYLTREITSDEGATDEWSRLAEREGPNRPVFFDIDMGTFNHLVSFERMTDTRVYFRDPATGSVLSLSKGDFIRSLVAVHYAESMEQP